MALVAHHLWGCVHGDVSWWDLWKEMGRGSLGWLQLSLQGTAAIIFSLVVSPPFGASE